MDRLKRQKKISNKQERKTAKQLGGKVMPASGATDFGKSDVRVAGKYRVECKYTEKDTYTLKFNDLIKLHKEATFGGLEHPIFQIEFKGNFKASYAIIPGYVLAHESIAKSDKNQIIIKAEELFKAPLFPYP